MSITQNQFFWGCKLDTSQPEETWAIPVNNESSILRVTQVVLGEDPSDDRHLIKVRTKGHDDDEFNQALFNLQLGKTEQLSTDFYFTTDTTFHLATGSGPVYISGYQSLVYEVAGGVGSYTPLTAGAAVMDSSGISGGAGGVGGAAAGAGSATAVIEVDMENSLKRRHSESEDTTSATGIPKNMKLIKMSRQSICNNIKMDPRNPEGLTDLWVGNVHPEVTEDVLRELFGRYGRVVSCHVLPKKYCAFINYAAKESAGKAMGALQNNKFHGVPLVIKFPEKRMGGGGGAVHAGGVGGGVGAGALNEMLHQEMFSPALMNAAAAMVSASGAASAAANQQGGAGPGFTRTLQQQQQSLNTSNGSSNYFKV